MKRVGKKRVWVLIGLAGIAGLLFAGLMWSGEAEARIEGRPVDFWVGCLPMTVASTNGYSWTIVEPRRFPFGRRRVTAEEIREKNRASWVLHGAGTNALPGIFRLLAAESSEDGVFSGVRAKVTGIALNPVEVRRWQAVTAMQALGQRRFDMEHYMSELRKLAASGDPNAKEAAKFLLRQLTDDRTSSRFALSDPDFSGRNLRQLEFGTVSEKAAAAYFFKEHPVLAEKVVPMLAENLSSTNASLAEESAKGLGAYGTNAIWALDELRKLAEHPKKYVRMAASNAVAAIETSR